ncbi:Solute carrier organic anion transporter family member 3A1 [Fukomys damarensis]|uniref:Solute carrier organic anion transporter family member 3A1 n=1 Tax=Fukomys damarensis TaxID=885580 RepID=A0A091EGL5_FUKDA|nr:Solute carrier organic anion transporter family member 3A1 [Fukomys damarensis]
MQGKKPGGSSGGGRSGELQGDEAQRNKKKKKKVSCFSNIKIFLVSECALMLAQGTVGAYLALLGKQQMFHKQLLNKYRTDKNTEVSVLTTLERRFNLQSADVGVIASSFEIGNLALILFVSYFGARGHRPRLIGCGGIVMALGALLSALPEFLTHQYKYEAGEIRWGAEGRDVCAANGSGGNEGPDPDLICRNRTATNMMYLLLIGAQVLLGIGATPVQPLGVSYIDDHVRRKDSSLYIGDQMVSGCCVESGQQRGEEERCLYAEDQKKDLEGWDRELVLMCPEWSATECSGTSCMERGEPGDRQVSSSSRPVLPAGAPDEFSSS